MAHDKLPYSKLLSFLREDDPQEEKLYLSPVKVKELQRRIDQLMEEQKPFLRQHYTMTEMAHDLDIPSYQLSAFVNKVMERRYTDLVNRYRIAYCLNFINNNSYTTLKVHQLSLACGFSNRNTFISAFKKFTNYTPHEYLSQLKTAR
ncbi:helix-turn-helix domain-containing protein [Chitinophagaceae bacterium LB-8]|uniref:Helix-turn-helix domain-containing protein n=1 Tax=Paraflavisolibacter caeni TaxID=2982496 RepID=A0A9X2XVL4_9BACT|nr:helix-turn-helix domain-containing protein [Paraflavisolibacter caeni]MCU7549402.1 helix-turn-helix domain-containing protein [Paraflavisolibacter caeni]